MSVPESATPYDRSGKRLADPGRPRSQAWPRETQPPGSVRAPDCEDCASSGHLAGELDLAAGPKNGDLERRSRRQGVEMRPDLRRVGGGNEPDPVHAQDDVAADRDRLTVDGGQLRASLDPHRLGRRVFRDVLDQVAERVRRQVEEVAQLGRENLTLEPAPERPLR